MFDLATIREVADLAGVSVATVSNVLNGKTKNAGMIERVEHAMRELSYRPDANARNMRSTTSYLIGVIVPNLTHLDYTMFLRTLEDEFRQKGYSILLKLSHNNRSLEKKSIEQCLEQRVDGFVLYSRTVRKNADMQSYTKVPSVLVTKYSLPHYSFDSVEIDYDYAFEQAVRRMKERGVRKLALLMEPEMLYNKDFMETYERHYPSLRLVKEVSYRSERGFKAAFELLCEEDGIDGFISGNLLIAQGARKALEVLGHSPASMAVIKEDNWLEDDESFDGVVSLSHKDVAQISARKLFDAIENPRSHERITENVRAAYCEPIPTKADVRAGSGSLKLAMLASPAARSLEMLSKIYSNKSGISLSFDMMQPDELEAAVCGCAQGERSAYDVFMLDILWLDSLADEGLLWPLDEIREKTPGFFEDYLGDVLQDCSEHNDSLFAFPFTSGEQLLFYQRDLFEDISLKRLFERTYGEELVAPATWSHFNLIAEFFTRSLNPKSPIEFGVSNVYGENSRTTLCFLDRLWAYGGEVFDEMGRVAINNNNALLALKNFTDSYRFSSFARENTSWNQVVDEFKSGVSAMVAIYDSYAVDINDFSQSKVAGNIGFGLLPGGVSVLGGWSLGVNACGAKKNEAVDFLLWACSGKNAVPITLLGGLTPRSSYYRSSIHHIIYPWKSLVTEACKLNRRRTIPPALGDDRLKNEIYSRVLSREIVRVLRGEITEKQALCNMEEKLNGLAAERRNAE